MDVIVSQLLLCDPVGASEEMIEEFQDYIGCRFGEELLAYLRVAGDSSGLFLGGEGTGMWDCMQGTIVVREVWKDFSGGMVVVVNGFGNGFVCVDRCGAVGCDVWVFADGVDRPTKFGSFVEWVMQSVRESLGNSSGGGE